MKNKLSESYSRQISVRLSNKIDDLIAEYKKGNAFSQAIISQILSTLLDIEDVVNFNTIYDRELKSFDKGRKALR